MEALHYIQNNWLVMALALIGALNIAIAGLRAMGYTKIADWCLRLEDAIKAMIGVALSQKKALKTILVAFLLVGLSGCALLGKGIHDSDYNLTCTDCKSQYGIGTVNVHIVGHTSWGQCVAK